MTERYTYSKALEAARKIQDIAGKNASSEDYTVADDLVDENQLDVSVSIEKHTPKRDPDRTEPYSEEELKELLYNEWQVDTQKILSRKKGKERALRRVGKRKMEVLDRNSFEVLWTGITDVYKKIQTIFPQTNIGLEEFATSLQEAKNKIQIKFGNAFIEEDEYTDIRDEVVVGTIMLAMKGQEGPGLVCFRRADIEYRIYGSDSVGIKSSSSAIDDEKMIIGENPFEKEKKFEEAIFKRLPKADDKDQ